MLFGHPPGLLARLPLLHGPEPVVGRVAGGVHTIATSGVKHGPGRIDGPGWGGMKQALPGRVGRLDTKFAPC